jgi:GNAT superfamily N-acetyltransferase
MLPVAPSLLVRPLQEGDRLLVAHALNDALAEAPYSTAFNVATLQEQLVSANPPSLHPVRWQRHQRLAAWRARRLEGFIDLAVGLDGENADLPDYPPFGLLRFFHLVERSERTDEVAAALLDAAEEFWRRNGVGYIKAFHHSTGYPNFQAGLGAVPGDWNEEVRALTNAGYQFTERFYCLSRPLADPVEEITPVAGLSLVYSGSHTDRRYQIYRRTAWVGMARVVDIYLDGAIGGHRLAKLMHIEIDPAYRGQDIGKWLVKRIINDCTMQGCSQLVAHLSQNRHIAISLLNQLGFLEENYRGYTLEKSLSI